MPIGLNLKLDTAANIQADLNDYVVKQLAQIIKPVEVTQVVSRYFAEAVRSHPTWQALLSGRTAGINDLRADFGIRRGSEQSRLDVILDAMVSSINTGLVPKAFKRSIRIRLPVKGVDADFKGVKDLPAAITMSRQYGPQPWFEWLVLKGDEAVVTGHQILYSTKFAGSRSGFAVMMVSPRSKFKVADGYQGTRENNFITESIMAIQNNPEMINALQQIMIGWIDKLN